MCSIWLQPPTFLPGSEGCPRKHRNSVHNLNHREEKLDEQHNPDASTDAAQHAVGWPHGTARMPTRRCHRCG